MDTFLIPMTLTLVVASMLAALPLLRLRRAKVAMQGTFGSLCVATGCGAFFALCSGFVGDFSTKSLFAADSGAKEAAKELPVTQPASDPSPATAAAMAPLDESTFFVKLPEGQLHTLPQVNPDSVVIPPGRPEWVGRNVTVGSYHALAASSGLYSTQAEAELALDKALKAKTDEYIAGQLGSTLAPQLVGYDVHRIKRELVKQENTYHEQVSVPSTGPMQQVHALIEFGPDFRQEVTKKWTDLTAYYRLLQTGLIAGGALLFLGTVFSYFRLDNATRGYYTGRLQFMTAAAILAIVGAGAVLARWIYWL